MTFLDAFRRPAVEARATVESPLVPLTSTTLLDWMSGPPSSSGMRVTEGNSLGMPAVWRAVNLIAGTCASLPLHAYQASDDVKVLASPNQQGARLLAQPHPDMTSYEFWEVMYANLLLWGNAYAQILRNQLGQITELWPIHPSKVSTGRSADRTKVYVINGDMDHPRTDREILHIPAFGYDGVVGLSPIQLARQGIGLALAAEQYGAKLFGSGSLASGILKVGRQLTQEQATRLKDSWKSRQSGLEHAHEVAVLDNGAEFQQLSIPPNDAQFVESRRFQISEVARIFGVPPHMLMDTTNSTSWGTGIEQQGIGFVVYTLRPWLTRVEQRMTQLINPSSVYAKYSVEGLLRGDTAARYASYATARQWGWMSVNEIRKLEDMAPVPEGDNMIQPLNMGALGQTGSDVPAPANGGDY